MNMDMFIPTEIKKIETQPREKFYLFDLLHLIFFTFILKLDTWERFIMRFKKTYFSGWQVK